MARGHQAVTDDIGPEWLDADNDALKACFAIALRKQRPATAISF
jgi:hypothetical protein